MNFTEADLLAYLDEALPPDQAAEVERAVRDSVALRQRLLGLLERRDQGGHTVGEIWRRGQLSCLGRTDLSRYLSGQLSLPDRDYVEFHVGGDSRALSSSCDNTRDECTVFHARVKLPRGVEWV